MTTHALIIRPHEEKLIQALKEKAAAHPMLLDQVKRLAAQREQTGDPIRPENDEYTVVLPIDYQVTYTHEEQPVGMCAHISISIDASSSRGPHPAAVNEILRLFGFVCRVDKPGAGHMWLDRDERLIINAVEPLKVQRP